MNKIVTILIIVGLGLVSFTTMDYALAVDCYDNFIFAWHTLNPVLECLDNAGGGGGVSDYELLCQNSISASNASSLSCSGFDAKKHLYVVSEIKSISSTGGSFVRANQSDITDYQLLHTGAGNARGAFEKITATGALIGVEIDTISVNLKKSGSPTGNLEVGIDTNGDGVVDTVFGTKDASTLTTTGTWYNFTKGGADHVIATNHRIGVFYDNTNSPNIVEVARKLADVYDGANSHYSLWIPNAYSDSANEFVFILYDTDTEVGLRPAITFNNDNATNYVYSSSLNLGAYSTVTNTDNCNLLHNTDMPSNDGGIFDMLIYNNISSDRKLGIGEGVYGISTNDSITPNDVSYKCKWDNTSSQITTVNLVSDAVGLFNQNSTITIWGYD